MAATTRFLVAGDTGGDLARLFARVGAVNAKHGPFAFLLCVGDFLGAADASAAALAPYLSGDAASKRDGGGWNRNQRAAGPQAEEPAGSSCQEGTRAKVGVSEEPRASTPRLGILAAGSLPGTIPCHVLVGYPHNAAGRSDGPSDVRRGHYAG